MQNWASLNEVNLHLFFGFFLDDEVNLHLFHGFFLDCGLLISQLLHKGPGKTFVFNYYHRKKLCAVKLENLDRQEEFTNRLLKSEHRILIKL